MNCLEILNLIAIILIPLIAVLISQWLQNRSEKLKDKMQIFKILMTSRIYGWTTDSVHALNLIDVIYVKAKKVRDAWKKLYEAYCSNDQSEFIIEKRKKLMYKLLEAMAENLGYKDKITWETIQNPYVPKGMLDMLDAQNKSQQEYTELLNNINKSVFEEKENTKK